MQEWVPAVTMLGLALIIGTALVLRGPMGKALADWIRGWSKTDEQWLAVKLAQQNVARQMFAAQAAKHGAVDTGATESLLAELDELKRRLSEAEERLDFTERLLAKDRDPSRLAPPR